MNSYIWIHILIICYNFRYKFRIYTFEFIYINACTHEFICYNHDMNSYSKWIHMVISHIIHIYMNWYVFELIRKWIHVYEYMNSYIWIYEFIYDSEFMNIWIHSYIWIYEFIHEFIHEVIWTLNSCDLTTANAQSGPGGPKALRCHWQCQSRRLGIIEVIAAQIGPQHDPAVFVRAALIVSLCSSKRKKNLK